MDPGTAERLAAVTGLPVSDTRRVEGGSPGAEHWLVALGDGSRRFVKIGTGDAGRAALQAEQRLYRAVQAPFCPRPVAWEDDPHRPMLVLEDLSGADWPPPWSGRRVRRVIDTLQLVAATPPPGYLPSLEERRSPGWLRVADDPRPLLQTRVVSAAWFREALPVLVAAADTAVLGGNALLHLDVRGGNVCLLRRRVVFVDWGSAAVGNPLADLVVWAPRLTLEGGPVPEALLGDEATELVALFCGLWAERLASSDAGAAETGRSLLRVALPWAAGLLGLPPPA
jgi:hypothetical protein